MPCTSNRTSPVPSSRYATRSPCNVMVLRFAGASLLAESGCTSRLGNETTAGAATTAAQAAAPTNRFFMAFMAFAPVCCLPLGRTIVDDNYRVGYGFWVESARFGGLVAAESR